MGRFGILALSLQLLLVLMACGKAPGGGPGGYTAGESSAMAGPESAPGLAATQSPLANPLVWIDQSRDEVVGKPDLVPPGSLAPMEKRLQRWLDLLQHQLELQSPDALRVGGVSIPQLKIRIDPDFGLNASVETVSVCYRVPMRLEATNPVSPPMADPNPGDVDPLILTLGSKGQFTTKGFSKISCLDRMQQSASAHDLLRYWEDHRLAPPCSLRVEEGVLVIGADCPRGPEVVTGVLAGVKLHSVSPWIKLGKGLVEGYENEAELISVLFHEAAHYFRSHGVTAKPRFQYFYRIGPEQYARPQPLPDTSLAALGAEVQGLPPYRTQPVQGQRWHSELISYNRNALDQLILPRCTDSSEAGCGRECAPFREFVDDQQARVQLGRFPQAQLTADGLVQYHRWEDALEQCFASIPLGDDGGNTVSWGQVAKVYWKIQSPAQPRVIGNLLDAVATMSQHLMDRDHLSQQALAKALNQRLGFYTSEEEADRLALEWLGLVGLEPEGALRQWLRFAGWMDPYQQEGPFQFKGSRCAQLYQAEPRWTEEGQDVLVPYGNFTGLHASPCFRAWNLDQRMLHGPKINVNQFVDPATDLASYEILRQQLLHAGENKL